METAERLLKMKEVQATTGLSLSGCYAHTAAGTWPSLTIGRSVRVPYGALVAWIKRNTQGGETKKPAKAV